MPDPQDVCTFEGIRAMQQAFALFVNAAQNITSQDEFKSLSFLSASFETREAWTACVGRFRNFFTEQSVTETIVGDARCYVRLEDPAWATDPCCNQTLAQTQCCAPRVQTVERSDISGYDNDLINADCAHPELLTPILDDFVTFMNAESSEFSDNVESVFRDFFEFRQTCQEAVFGGTCQSDADCAYSGFDCDQGSGRCRPNFDRIDEGMALCFVDKIADELLYEFLRIWQLPFVVNTLTRSAAIKAEFRSRLFTDDCVGRDAWQYRSHWEGVLDAETGRYQNVFVPGNQTACLERKACNWDGWGIQEEARCTGAAVINERGDHFCQVNYGGNMGRDITIPSVCLSDAWTENDCQSPGVWNMNKHQCIIPGAPSSDISLCLPGDVCAASREAIMSRNYSNPAFGSGACFTTSCMTPSITTEADCNTYRNNLYSACSTIDCWQMNYGQLVWNVFWSQDGHCLTYLNNIPAALGRGQELCDKQEWILSNASMTVTQTVFHQGSRFFAGSFNTESVCTGTCNVPRLSSPGVTQEQCEAETFCSLSCGHCRAGASSFGSTAEQDAYLCYDSSIMSSDNCTGTGFWNTMANKCTYDYNQDLCSALGLEGFSCLTDDQGAFRSQAGCSEPADWRFAALNCRFDQWDQCLDQNECAEQGQCDDWEFKNNYVQGVNQHGACVNQAVQDNMNGCPQDMFTVQAGDFSYQQQRYQQSRIGCVDQMNPTQAQCMAAGLMWINAATTEQECIAHGARCQLYHQQGGQSFTEQQCADCDGDYIPLYNWVTGNNIQGKWLPASWKPRAWESINNFAPTLDWGKLDLVTGNAISRILGRRMLNALKQKYSKVFQVLRAAACDCTVEGARDAGICFDVAAQDDVNCPVVPGQPSVCIGTSHELNFSSNSFTSGQPPTDVPTQVTPAGLLIVEEAVSQNSGSGQSGMTAMSIGHQNVRKYFQNYANGNSDYYSIVRNANNVIVGQIVGSGVTFQLPAGTTSLTLCLSISASIDQDSTAFPVRDFASGTETTVGMPLGLPVYTRNSQYCALVTTSGTFYPIRRATNYASTTTGYTPTNSLIPTNNGGSSTNGGSSGTPPPSGSSSSTGGNNNNGGNNGGLNSGSVLGASFPLVLLALFSYLIAVF